MSQTGTAPVPENGAQKWELPEGDQEFVFEGADTLPGWADPNWLSYNQGPALAVPAGDLYGEGPYHTKTARMGDTVKYFDAKGSMPPHFEVIPGEMDPEAGVNKHPPAMSNCSLEDALKTGYLTPDDLNEEGKAQVAARSPRLAKLVLDGTNPPEAQAVSEIVKVA